jgi:ribose transport system substrate-binding protein
MKRTLLKVALVCVLALSFGPAIAQAKKILAIVVKGLDNPFFEQINLGCQKWQKENPNSEYTCYYTGPASSADEAGEVKIVDDHLMGVKMAEHAKRLKPNGGTVCLQLGNVAADNINARAAGFRDTVAGKKGVDRLKGENGWSEVEGCPVFTNDQADLANQQMADVFLAKPNLDAFVLVGGWAQFAPQAYAQVTNQVMDKLKSKKLVIIAGDTLPPQMEALKAGRSHVQVGQRPFEMGYRAPSVMIDLIKGKKVSDPLFTGLDECTPETADTCLAK